MTDRMEVSLEDLLKILRHAEWIGDDTYRTRIVSDFGTDSRQISGGEVFFALHGERFDGHDFIGEIADAGAAAAVVSRIWYESEKGFQPSIPLLLVDEPLHAWGDVARAHRLQFDIPVVAVAGSNGKTTTKELVAAVLAKKFDVLKTEGNLNNQIGAPATLLRLRRQHEAAVIEIGTNMPGEIAILADIVQPTHGLITNIGREHLELLGSIEGVAREEGALFRYLQDSGGVAVVNMDDPHVSQQSEGVEHRVRFGFGEGAEVTGERRGVTQLGGTRLCISAADGSHECELQLPGEHNATNALAAAAVGYSLGVPLADIIDALKQFEPLRGKNGYARLAPMRAACGAFVLNDTYNSNPDSTRVALSTLRGIAPSSGGRRIVVLGDMKELGITSSDEHRLLGEELAAAGIDAGYFLGAEMRHAHESFQRAGRPSHWFEDRERLIETLSSDITAADAVLVKGSRSMAMEEVVKRICG